MKLTEGQRFRCQCRKSVLLLPELEDVKWGEVDVFESDTLWLWGTGADPVLYPKQGPWEVVLPRPLDVADTFWLMSNEKCPWAARLVVDGVTLDPLVYELVVIEVKDLDDPKAEARMRAGDEIEEKAMDEFVGAIAKIMEERRGVPAGTAAEPAKVEIEPPAKPGGRKVEWE